MRRILSIIAVAALGLPIPTGGQAWDTFSDTWTATDALGRTLPSAAETGGPRPGKQVGIFYFLWLGRHGSDGPFNISEILDRNPGALQQPEQALPARVDDVRLAVRDASGEAHDLAAPRPVDLAPGESRAFAGSWTLVAMGRWTGWIELRYGDQRFLLGEAPAFAFAARLPRDPDLRRWTLAELRLSATP